jgi:hypothetical protein
MPSLRGSLIVLVLFLSSCHRIGNDDRARIARYIDAWNLNGRYAMLPFYGHKEWSFLRNVDSEAVAYLHRIDDWERIEHSCVDSLSATESMIPIKLALHSYLRAYFRLFRVDATFPPVASKLRASFLISHTVRGDSLLSSARALLGEVDTSVPEMARFGSEFNTCWRDFGGSDTLRFGTIPDLRSYIVNQYVYFLAPELKRYLLSTQ